MSISGEVLSTSDASRYSETLDSPRQPIPWPLNGLPCSPESRGDRLRQGGN